MSVVEPECFRPDPDPIFQVVWDPDPTVLFKPGQLNAVPVIGKVYIMELLHDFLGIYRIF
jgi:hypothetical protein